MCKLKINSGKENILSVDRIISMNPKHFDKLTKLREKHKISLNNVVNQCIEFALENLDSDA